MSVTAPAILCPLSTCRSPAKVSAAHYECESGHAHKATYNELSCPRCLARIRQIVGNHGTFVCASCARVWSLDQVQVTDEVRVELVESSSACDQVMLAVDAAVDGLKAQALAAVEAGDTTLREIADRFRRRLLLEE